MDVELEFDKKCRISLSPKTVLPLAPRSVSFHKEDSKKRRDQSLVVEECTSNDIRFDCYRSASCRSIPSASRLSVVDGPVEVKRGSVYQDSREVRKMKRTGDGTSRRKIEISRTSEHKNADGKQENYWQDLPVHPELIRSSRSKLDKEACLLDSFIDIVVDTNDDDDDRRVVRKELYGDLSYLVEGVNGPKNDGNILLDKDEVRAEVEGKLETLQMYSSRESIDTPKSRTSSKSSSSRFSPIKKMMDPFLKSKSHISPLSFEANGLNDGNGCGKSRPNPAPINLLDLKENVSVVQESPTLLHACLKLKTKYETPLFEFTMKNPEVNFLARIWKRNSNAGDWVYTIHSVNARKRGDSSRWGLNKDSKELPVVGQMQVSSRLCPESKSIADRCMVTEFVLYDLGNTVKPVHDTSESTPDTSQLLKVPEGCNLNQDLATLALPWEPATLHPNLETGAIIIQIPLERRESLKFNKSVDMESEESLLCINDVRQGAPFDSVDVPEIVVVTPAGSHSLPDAENQGPSSLLDRWRLGGGCECGGWDMGCPLTVIRNPFIQKGTLILHEDNTNNVELPVQGERCKKSSLSIKVIEGENYDVMFHARLSALQAFSISVAILHGSETSLIQSSKKSSPAKLCSPLKQLIEHELEILMEAFPKEESKQTRSPNRESHLSFTVNPPFSPISRV